MARAGGEIRGSAKDRRARRANVMRFYGDGIKVACVHCAAMVLADEMEIDKIIPGHAGPGYIWANILPSCKPCNRTRSDNTTDAEIISLQARVIIRTARDARQMAAIALGA